MIAEIENAILARTKAASDAGALGYRYRTLETYPVDWDERLAEKAVLVAPAAWVTFAGWRPLGDTEDSGRGRVELSFGIVVMAENLRGETATRHGGPDQTKEPGSYRLAVDVARLMVGQDLDLPMAGFRVGALHFVRQLKALEQRKVSMLALELRTDVLFNSIDFGSGGLADFTAFHANWDVPPFGGIDADPDEPGTQLPADSKADATDHVEMEI